MAVKYNDAVDLSNNELLNVVLQNLAADPGAGLVDGRIWYDTALDAVRVRANGVSVSLASGMDTEVVQDIVGAMVAANVETGITVTYDDTDGTLDFAVTDSPLLGGQNSAFHLARANHTGTQLSTTISDFTEGAQDAAGALFAAGTRTGITVTYDDANGEVDFAVTDSPLLGGQNSAFHLARANHTGTQVPATITFASTDRLLGRDTAGAGVGEELTPAAVKTMLAIAAADITDFAEGVSDQVGTMVTGNTESGITVAYDDTDNTLDFTVTDSPTVGGFTPAQLRDRSTHTGTQAPATIQVSATDRLLGRDTAAAGPAEELTVGGGIEFTGTGIQSSAHTGDVTKSAGGTVTTIAANVVTNTKLADVATATIKGRVTAATGDPEDLTAAQAKTVLAIVPADVAGFDTQVRTSRLDQMAVPTADLNVNNRKITNLLDPTGAQDAATKAYVDAARTGLDVKASVDAASIATAGTYSATGGASARGQLTGAPNTLDGVTLAANDRILMKDHSTPAANGIYVVTTLGTGANGVWDRASDFDADAEVTSGAFTFVSEGTVNADSGWVLATNDPIIIGGASGTSLTFAQFSGAGQIIAGNALTKTGNTLDVAPGTGLEISADTIRIAAAAAGNGLTGGAGSALAVGVGTGLVVTADAVAVDRTTGAGRVPLVYAVTLTGGATSEVITHNLGTRDVVVMIYLASGTFAEEVFTIEHTSTTTITIRSSVTIPGATYRVVVLG